MGGAWRSLALAAALNSVLAAGLATAQTVTAVGAPRGSAVELTLNDARFGTATVDASGTATFPLTLVKPDSKTELNLRVVVDTCDALHRVHLFEPNQELSPVAPGCTRRQFTELFIIRQVTTHRRGCLPRATGRLGEAREAALRMAQPQSRGHRPPARAAPVAQGARLLRRRRPGRVLERRVGHVRGRANVCRRLVPGRPVRVRRLLVHAIRGGRGGIPEARERLGKAAARLRVRELARDAGLHLRRQGRLLGTGRSGFTARAGPPTAGRWRPRTRRSTTTPTPRTT